ncbi:uncharacterized protein PG986_006253 [Apiospora aurea]|uniref:Uncharacterized protein n=1 Tax=Apiospora aurea TaxID=335848 RepID=A0ABR1QJX0_9PEZI
MSGSPAFDGWDVPGVQRLARIAWTPNQVNTLIICILLRGELSIDDDGELSMAPRSWDFVMAEFALRALDPWPSRYVERGTGDARPADSEWSSKAVAKWHQPPEEDSRDTRIERGRVIRTNGRAVFTDAAAYQAVNQQWQQQNNPPGQQYPPNPRPPGRIIYVAGTGGQQQPQQQPGNQSPPYQINSPPQQFQQPPAMFGQPGAMPYGAELHPGYNWGNPRSPQNAEERAWQQEQQRFIDEVRRLHRDHEVAERLAWLERQQREQSRSQSPPPPPQQQFQYPPPPSPFAPVGQGNSPGPQTPPYQQQPQQQQQQHSPFSQFMNGMQQAPQWPPNGFAGNGGAVPGQLPVSPGRAPPPGQFSPIYMGNGNGSPGQGQQLYAAMNAGMPYPMQPLPSPVNPALIDPRLSLSPPPFQLSPPPPIQPQQNPFQQQQQQQQLQQQQQQQQQFYPQQPLFQVPNPGWYFNPPQPQVQPQVQPQPPPFNTWGQAWANAGAQSPAYVAPVNQQPQRTPPPQFDPMLNGENIYDVTP